MKMKAISINESNEEKENTMKDNDYIYYETK
jgi:hypothetical protein